MKIERFRVENFRNIDDSGWIPLEQVTAFVGRNESGKTTLLKALHKFNPATPEAINPQRDFPRDRYTRDYDDATGWHFCSVVFALSDALRAEIAAAYDLPEPPTHASCIRYYDGSLSVELTPEVVEHPVPSSPLLDALAEFAKAARRLEKLDDEEEERASERRAALATWASEWRDRFASTSDLKQKFRDLKDLKSEAESKSSPQTADAVEALLEAISPALDEASREPVAPLIESMIEQRLPVFVYFENFGVLDSAIYLPRFLEDLKSKPSDARVRTVSALFSHVKLSPSDIAGLAREETREQRQAGQQITATAIQNDRDRKDERAIKLSSASLDLTHRFSEWWSQRRHNIRYDADGDYFRIWVSDDRRPGVEIELEERSKGFQWFLSFYLVFLVEADEGHKDAVILLDEPGLHLHPTAQHELIGFFDKLSEKNQLLYSTHSPFLIDGEKLHRIRPVVEDDAGHSHISVGEWPKDRETIFPLQAAAGYAMVRGLFQHTNNVLVEGMTDYYLLHLINQQVRASGRKSLPDDIYITPCGGTKMVGHLASLFLGQNVRPVVLLDGDSAGRTRRDALLKELYAGESRRVVMVDEALQVADAEIEDILGGDILAEEVNRALKLKLKLSSADRESATAVAQVEAAAKRQAISLPEGWKPTTALHMVRRWAESGSALPDEVLERGETLFVAIRNAFARPSAEASEAL